MYFSKVLVLVLVSVAFCAAHPGEPQSWLSTLFQLVERILGTEMAVKSLTDTVSVNTQRFNDINEKLSQVKSLENAVSVCINKTGALELELSASMYKVGSLETALMVAGDDNSSQKQEGLCFRY